VGHSAPRTVWKEGEASKIHKRLELLPEEALYLVERGTLFCTKESSTLKSNVPGSEDIEGAPMSVQQAFAEMIGTEDLSLEKYQVCYLYRPSCVISINGLLSGFCIFKKIRLLCHARRTSYALLSVCTALYRS
jgi:tRNA-splicing endonuclease subunit Sen54